MYDNMNGKITFLPAKGNDDVILQVQENDLHKYDPGYEEDEEDEECDEYGNEEILEDLIFLEEQIRKMKRHIQEGVSYEGVSYEGVRNRFQK